MNKRMRKKRGKRFDVAEEAAVDHTDVEAGRTPFRSRALAERINNGDELAASLSGLNEGAQRRAQEARTRYAERIEANRAAGLNPSKPALEDDMVPMDEQPAEGMTQRTETHQPDPVNEQELDGVTVGTKPVVDEAEQVAEILARGNARMAARHEDAQRKALQKLPQIIHAGSKLRTLEDAAEVLIAELQPNHQDQIRDVMREDNLPNWAVLLGAVKRIADLNELNAGDFDPDWLNRGNDRTAVRAKEEVCQTCGGVLPPDPVKRNRVACCNKHGSGFIDHTEGCPLGHLQMKAGKWVSTSIA